MMIKGGWEEDKTSEFLRTIGIIVYVQVTHGYFITHSIVIFLEVRSDGLSN